MLTVLDHVILANVPFEYKEVLKGIPGVYYLRPKWYAVPSPYTVKALAESIPSRYWHSSFWNAYESAEDELALLGAMGDATPRNMVYTPWQHQLAAFRFAIPRAGSLLAMDMGTGKTYVSIALLNSRDSRRALIVCPKSVMPVWPAEFAKHSTRGYRIHLSTAKGTAKRAQLLRAFFEGNDAPSIAVVNYESVWREPLASTLRQLAFDSLILDECDLIKGYDGKATDFLYELGVITPYRIGLTGTPMPHDRLDVYGQLRAIEPGIFGVRWTAFKQEYADFLEPGDTYTTDWGTEEIADHPMILGWKNTERFTERLARVTFSVKRSEVFDLPPVTHVNRYCRFTDYKPYRKMAREYVAYVNDTCCVAQNALVKGLRLQQMTSGFLVDDETGVEVPWNESKALLLQETLDDIPRDEPVVVYCWFRHDVQKVIAVAEACGRATATLDDLVDGKFPSWANVMVLQLKSGSRGIDLTRAAYGVYYSVSFDGGAYGQSLARQDRHGQTRPVTLYHLLVEDTIDDVIHQALSERLDVNQALMDAAKKGKL